MSEESDWAEGCRDHIDSLAENWGVADAFAADTRALVPAFQAYVDGFDFDASPVSEIQTVHSDLAAYLAEHLIRTFDARWASRVDMKGRLWVVTLGSRAVDPFDVAHDEIVHRPVQITRLLAKGEQLLGATARIDH